MNTQKVKTEITNIISELKERIGAKNHRKQYAAGKKQRDELTELGIIDLMPIGFGFSDADAVIKAAKDAGRTVGGFNAEGEGESAQIGASALYNVLHEVEVAEETEENTVYTFTVDHRDDQVVVRDFPGYVIRLEETGHYGDNYATLYLSATDAESIDFEVEFKRVDFPEYDNYADEYTFELTAKEIKAAIAEYEMYYGDEALAELDADME